jgi:hypothetical protein
MGENEFVSVPRKAVNIFFGGEAARISQRRPRPAQGASGNDGQ